MQDSDAAQSPEPAGQDLDKRVRELEARCRFLEDALPHSLFQVDADGRLTYANQRLLNRYGQRLEDLLGKTNADFFDPELAAKYDADNARVMAEDREIFEVEINIDPNTGHREFVEVAKAPIHDANGRVVGVQGMFWDVTERVIAEQALQERDRWLELVVDNSPFEIGVVTRDGVLLRPMLGLHAGQNLHAQLTPKSRPIFEQGCARVFAGESPVTIDIFTTPAEQALRLTLTSMAHDGPAHSIAIFALNIDREKQLEAEVERNRRIESLGQFSGGIAHDLNNLLTVILAATELLSLSPGVDRELIDETREATRLAGDLTHSLLRFAGRQVVQCEVIAVPELLESFRRLIIRLLPASVDLELRDLSDGAKLWADRAQLHNALVNLSANAVEAMPEGGRLTLEVRPHGTKLNLALTDTGVGIDEATLKRIFEPFFSTKTKDRASGLGLASVAGFARQSGGDIEAESQPGHGTTISLILPRPDQQLNREEQSAGLATRKNKHTKPLRLLVVEDHPRVAALIERVLVHSGHAVDHVTTVAAAEQTLANDQGYDLVISDWALPDGDADDMTRARASGIPVAIISGYRPGHAQGQSARVGEYLRKPFTPQELLDFVARKLPRSIR